MEKNEGAGESRERQWGSMRLFYAGTILIFLVLAFTQLQISSLKEASGAAALSAGILPRSSAAPASSPSSALAPQLQSTVSLSAVQQKILPKGVPAAYGSELGISYDDPVSAMKVLAALDDGKGMADSAMNGRYVRIGSQIACEYCCGAQTLVFADGRMACGCAHSYAMRGLAKYLISKHGSEFTDEQVLAELGKWKLLFFPQPMMSKAMQFAAAGKDLNIVDLTSNRFRGFTSAAGESGGATAAGSLPNQVGGC